MKTYISITLIIAATSAQEELTAPNFKEITQLVDGFLLGALQTEQVYDLDTCLKDVNPLITDMTTAIEDFKDGSYYRITDGIYQLGQFVSQIKVVTKDCSIALREEDMDKLKAMEEAFLHPKQLILNVGEDLVVNGVEIYQDVKKGIQFFDSS